MLNEKKLHQMIEMQKTEQRLKKQKGASMIEYALVVAAVVGLGVTFFGGDTGISGAIDTRLTNVAAEIDGTAP